MQGRTDSPFASMVLGLIGGSLLAVAGLVLGYVGLAVGFVTILFVVFNYMRYAFPASEYR